jgi:hypothetical protein
MTAEENDQISKILKGQEAVLRNPNAMENMQKDLSTTEIPAEIKQRLEGVDFEGIKESLLSKPNTPNQPESLLQRK